VLSFALMGEHVGAMPCHHGQILLDRLLSITCRWSAAKQDFLKALQLDAASGAKDNAALLNNLGMSTRTTTKRHGTGLAASACSGFEQASEC
jgi:hypothetical protein